MNFVTPDSQELLTGRDRCDRCGAQAFVRVDFVFGGHLLFCGHHARRHRSAWQPVARTVQDETAKITRPVPLWEA